MRVESWFVIVLAFLAYVRYVGGSERRTCEVQVTNTETVNKSGARKDEILKKQILFCCDGYNPDSGKARHFVEVKSDNECIPYCYPTCPANSTCQPPTTCECSTGSKFTTIHYANKCKCNKGFIEDKKGQCTPICPDNCTNGICNELICTCNKGYKLKNLNVCIPECNGACKEYQECTSPGRCTLKPCKEPGYERNEMNECVPKCHDGCLNGKCTPPEICICNEGYQKNEVTMKCEARCQYGCLNGNCTAPETCICHEGYQKNELTMKCEARCQYGCLNGKCTAPEICICNEGYQKNEVTMKCEAKCDNCTNGFCMIPQECVCNLSYKNVEGVCVKITTVEESSDIMGTLSSTWLLFWLSDCVLLLVVVVTLGHYRRTRIAADSDKNERIGELEQLGPSDIAPKHCDSDLSDNVFALYEEIGEVPTIVIGQGALPMSRLESISSSEREHCVSSTDAE